MKLTYGVPLWLMKEYLADLGAVETQADVMVGPDWQATVSKAEPYRVGSLVVGRINVELSGDEAAIEAMLAELHWKTLRGGG